MRQFSARYLKLVSKALKLIPGSKKQKEVMAEIQKMWDDGSYKEAK